MNRRNLVLPTSALFAAALIGCGGGGGGGGGVSTNPSPIVGVDSGGAANPCPNASNSFGYYPSAELCNYYKLANFMIPYSGTMNFTSYYLDTGSRYPAGVHNGIDFQTSDVAGQKCETTQDCVEHDILAPADSQVAAINNTYGAVTFTFKKPSSTGASQQYQFSVLHMKPGSYSHLELGRWVPMGKKIGTQWNKSAVNGTANDISAHTHLEFSAAGTDRVLTQRADSQSLPPIDFLSWINENIDSIASKKSAMAVTSINVTGQTIIGKTVTIRANGSNFPPSSFLGIWSADSSQDQSVATCDMSGFTRGTANGLDYLEQQCTLNRVGSFNIFIKAKSGEATITTQPISVAAATSPTCTGLWSSTVFTTNQVEVGTDNCPTGQSGYIKKTHTCQTDGSWGQITYSPICAKILLPPTNVNVSRGSGYIDVSWTGSVGATEYQVWREVSPNLPVLYTQPISTSYRDTAITKGNQYCYYISAVREYPGGADVTGHPAYACIVAQ